jgi:NADH:ubiquinone oxidoreductase subunit 6 (subunit J)
MTFGFFEQALFALLTVGIIGAGAGVVFLNRITGAALLMAFAFLCNAGMFILLGAETIAAFQVLIYVGAISVLILYGVMFTPQGDRDYRLFFQNQTPWAALFVVPLAIFVFVVGLFSFQDSGNAGARGSDLTPLATSVFRDFAFPFEIASVLLLAAMIGAIVLVKRDEDE